MMIWLGLSPRTTLQAWRRLRGQRAGESAPASEGAATAARPLRQLLNFRMASSTMSRYSAGIFTWRRSTK